MDFEKLINASDLIEWIMETDPDWCVGAIRSIVDHIDEMPSAQPEQQWIPCSETIDIPEREVLCCDRYGNEIIGYLAYVDEQWLCESETEMMYDPVAWMEKPEPWKGEQDG